MKVPFIRFIVSIIAALSLGLVHSCTPYHPSATPSTQTKTELLTGNNWVLTAFTLDGEDKFKDIPNCEKDNIDKYLPNGDYLYDVGTTKCGNENQVRAIANWVFEDSENSIKRSDGLKVFIQELSETKLVTQENRANGSVAHYEYKAIPTFYSILMASKWKVTHLTYNGTDIYNTIPDCEKDNLISFKTNEEYIIDEGATKCNPNDPQTNGTGTWKFSDYETKITISTLGTDPLSIVGLSTTKMVINDGFGLVYTYTAQ